LVRRLQLGQDIRRHHARSGTELQDVCGADPTEHFDALIREAATEERRDFGRGHEVAGLSELRSARAVVAEPRLVERKLHETLEADPALMRVDLVANAIDETRRVRCLLGTERR